MSSMMADWGFGGGTSKAKEWVRQTRERHARERAEMLKQLEARDERAAAAAFDKMDVDGRGAMTREEARQLLQIVVETDDINEHGLDMVFLPACASAHDANTENAFEGGAISISVVPQATRDELIKGIKQYRIFLKRFGEVEEIFKRYDADRNDGLDRNELRQVIRGAESALHDKNMRRRLERIQPEEDKRRVGLCEVVPEPTDLDLDTILFECDVNRDGYINRAETLAALCMWARLASQQIEEQQAAWKRKQRCCALS